MNKSIFTQMKRPAFLGQVLIAIITRICLFGSDNPLYFVCDLISSLCLNSPDYLLLSSVLPQSNSSVENMLYVLGTKNGIFHLILAYSNLYYVPLLTKTNFIILISTYFPFFKDIYQEYYETSQIINLNAFWFFHLNMFEQYNSYFFDIINAIFVYCARACPKHLIFFIIFIFKRNDLRSFLMVYKYYKLEMGHVYFMLGFAYLYFKYIFELNGIVNPNFINWVCIVFMVVLCCELFAKENFFKNESDERSKTK